MRCGLAYPRGRSPPPPTLRTGRCGRSATGCPPGTLKGRCLRRARSDIASHEAQPEKGVRVGRTRRGATTTGDRRTDSSIRVLGHGQPTRITGRASVDFRVVGALSQSRPWHASAMRPRASSRDAILQRVRNTPEGFVRHTETSRRGRRGRRGGAPRLRRPDDAMAPDRPRGRIAGQGPRQRRLLMREGVPFRGERVDMRVARMPGVMWIQRHLRLSPQPRGFHLITREVVEALPELEELRVGMLHLLIQHTSASLALNENASPDVRRDFATGLTRRSRTERRTGRTRSRATTTCPLTSSRHCWARR